MQKCGSSSLFADNKENVTNKEMMLHKREMMNNYSSLGRKKASINGRGESDFVSGR